MLTRVVQRSDAWEREVLGDRERHRADGQTRKRGRAEVLLDVALQSIADRFAVQDTPRHQRAGDLAGGGRPAQQDPDLLDLPDGVDACRDGLDVQDRHPGPGRDRRVPQGRDQGIRAEAEIERLRKP